MKFSLILSVIFAHAFIVAIANYLPIFQPAIAIALVIEAGGILIWSAQTKQLNGLAAIVGLALALVMGL